MWVKQFVQDLRMLMACPIVSQLVGWPEMRRRSWPILHWSWSMLRYVFERDDLIVDLGGEDEVEFIEVVEHVWEDCELCMRLMIFDMAEDCWIVMLEGGPLRGEELYWSLIQWSPSMHISLKKHLAQIGWHCWRVPQAALEKHIMSKVGCVHLVVFWYV